MKTNQEKLVKLSVMGAIDHPTLRKTGYVISSQGQAEVYPSVGGVTYNIRIGDPAIGWMADHVEPGASIINTGKSVGEYSPNGALNVLACIGNEATVVSGEAKGARGYVTGKHGGIDHVMVDFEPDVLENLLIDDKILIKSFGVGLQLEAYPEIKVMNIDPGLLEILSIKQGSQLKIGVTHILPAKLMGAGLGNVSAHSGDYDIQMFDQKAISEYHLDSLRFGDVVAIMDSDASYGWIYREGAVTIGVIAHSNSVISGHGPGVTTIFTSSSGKIEPVLNRDANLKNYLYQK
ncbi:MAG TPA: DUF4438 domain-containing protein [Caldithrix sp.]|nr:DUF4438 domain-containing protein [Caldithrix sp.]